MNIFTDNNGFSYFNNLKDCKPEFVPIKVWSLLQFFTLAGRRTSLLKENLSPLDCQYVVLTKTDPPKYYLRSSRKYDVDSLFFFRNTLDFSGNSESIDTFRRYIFDDRVWLLMTEEQVADTKKMLERICKGGVNGEASLSYKMYLEILERELKLADYKDYGKNHTGFRTCVKIQEDAIRELWKQCLIKK